MSLHIGLNHVDPKQYEGWDGELNACEADARDMEALATRRKFKSRTVLLTKQATAEAVTDSILGAAKSLKAGDMFLLTYSGHGGQVTDTNHDEKGDRNGDRKDETWVCYDRELVDDELYDLWGKFKTGVRVFVLSDSCHSGTVVKAMPAFLDGGRRVRGMPPVVAREVEKAHKKLYRGIQNAHPAAEKARLKASVLLISGCMDNQFSQDGDENGLFTGTLKSVWDGGRFKAGYRPFRDQIVARMPEDQTPNYYWVGARSPKFEAQVPFTI
jgi:hypothetical protein